MHLAIRAVLFALLTAAMSAVAQEKTTPTADMPKPTRLWECDTMSGERGGLRGHFSLIHTAKILRLSGALPIVIKIVDTKKKINAFLPVLDGMIRSGLATLEKVQVLQYCSNKPGHED